jgi:hypothetical protein
MSEWVTITPSENGQLTPVETNDDPNPDKYLAPAPELMSAGSYAIYKTPSGGWHISYIPNDTDKMGHFEIPAIAVQMFQQLQAGEGLPSPMEMVKRMMAARNG